VIRVSATGGEPAQVTTPTGDEASHHWPVWLPDQRYFLFRAANGAVFRASIDGGAPTRLLNTDGRVEFAAPDTLLFPRGTGLMAQSFDPARGELRGEPIRLVDQIQTGFSSRAAFSSQANVLTYRSGGTAAFDWHLYDPGGRPVRPLAPLKALRGFSPSPDGRLIAIHAHEGTSVNGELWLLELARGTLSRLGASPSHDDFPNWSPDGKRLVVQSSRNGGGLWLIAPGGDAPDEQLLGDRSAVPSDWSSDGRWVVYDTPSPKTGSDIWAVPATGRHIPEVLVQTPFDERNGALSPDGRWLAYTSTETTRQEIYLQPFPATGAKTRVSTAGGSHARWARGGEALYYRAADRVVRVPVRFASGSIEVGAPEPLFTLRLTAGAFSASNSRYVYTLGPNGVGFIAAQEPASSVATPLTVVLNWRALLQSGSRR